MKTDINRIINAIEGHRINDEKKLFIRNGSLEFIFFHQDNREAVERFFDKYKFTAPEDYLSFLSLYSSARLFKHSYYGGGYEILSLDNIIKYWKSYSIDAPYYPIAWSSHSLGSICVNQEQVGSGNGYLTWIDSMDRENPVELKIGFSSWLKKIIECGGKEFWLE